MNDDVSRVWTHQGCERRHPNENLYRTCHLSPSCFTGLRSVKSERMGQLSRNCTGRRPWERTDCTRQLHHPDSHRCNSLSSFSRKTRQSQGKTEKKGWRLAYISCFSRSFSFALTMESAEFRPLVICILPLQTQQSLRS